MFSLSLQCAKLGATTRVSFSNTELSSHHNGFNIKNTRPYNTSAIFHGFKNDNIQLKKYIFLFLLKKIVVIHVRTTIFV